MINNIYDYKYIIDASTVVVTPNAATLGGVMFGSTLVGTVDVYNANNTTTNPVAHFSAGSLGGEYHFDVTCGFGITVVTSSSADDVTITFKTH